MFKWLKGLFCHPSEQNYTICFFISGFEHSQERKKRKYVKSGKYIGKFKSKKKKVKKGRR